MYHFGANEVADFLGAKSPRTLIAWLDNSETPTDEQVSRLEVAYTQFNRVNHGEGPVRALAWFMSDDIGRLIREDQFQQVKESATHHMMPHD